MSVQRPHYRKDIDLLEWVQRRALKLIDGFTVSSCEDRLRVVDLTSLETRRIRGDRREDNKIMHGLTELNPEGFFTFSTGGLRGHRYKLFKPRKEQMLASSLFLSSWWICRIRCLVRLKMRVRLIVLRIRLIKIKLSLVGD